MPANLVQPLDAKLHDPTRYTFPTRSMTAAEFRRLALSLPEAVESSPYLRLFSARSIACSASGAITR